MNIKQVTTGVKKVATGSNLKWVGLIALAFTFFRYAQGQAEIKGAQTIKIDTNLVMIQQLVKADSKAVEFRVEQTAQMATLKEKTDNIEEDVDEIKEDNKEMLRLLIELNNK